METKATSASPAAAPVPPVPAPVQRRFFLHPREWDAREYVFLAGAAITFISTVALRWVKVEVDFIDPILGISWFKGDFGFKVLENGALSAAVIILLLLCVASMFGRGRLAWAGVALSLGLLACFAYYLYSLARQAYDALGFLDSMLEMLRQIPVLGPQLAEMTRQAVLDSIKSVSPQPGLFLYAAGDLALLAASILRLRRRA
jgi:hypothetical protein